MYMRFIREMPVRGEGEGPEKAGWSSDHEAGLTFCRRNGEGWEAGERFVDHIASEENLPDLPVMGKHSFSVHIV